MVDGSGIRVEARLAETPARNRTFWLPDLLSEVIDEMVDRAGRGGYPTGRAQIVAGLIFAARDRAPDEIEGLVRNYLTAEVGTVAAGRAVDGLVQPRPAIPGRRPARRG